MKQPHYIYAVKSGAGGHQKVASLVPVRGGWGVDYLVRVADMPHPIRRFYVRDLLYAAVIVINTLVDDGWRDFEIVRWNDLGDYDESPQSNG
jgi:hypothetical protein